MATGDDTVRDIRIWRSGHGGSSARGEGFYFAEFKGDHIRVLKPGYVLNVYHWETIRPYEVAQFTNAIKARPYHDHNPPTESKGLSADKGE